MHDAFIGVGSNVEPAANICLAVDALSDEFEDLRCSSVYQSPAHGFAGDDFLNMVIAVRSTLSPSAIEDRLTSIEDAAGRERGGERYCARTLDLDLLLCGAAVDARLRLPRDDILRYPFVLAPLAEIAPALAHPVSGQSMLAAWQEMNRAGGLRLEKLGPWDALEAALPADAPAAVDG